MTRGAGGRRSFRGPAAPATRWLHRRLDTATHRGGGFLLGMAQQDRVAVGTGDGVSLGELFGADSETLDFAELPRGYPTVLSASGVPEPPAVAILLTGLTGLLGWRCRSRRALRETA